MKSCAAVFLLLVAGAAAARVNESPMSRVVALIQQLKARIEDDGKLEQQSYDKYACWCENTLGRKANDISNGKERITELQMLITKLGAEIAAHGVEILQLKKDIAANIEAQREATELRNKENEEYTAEKTESEQCIGALEAAVKALTGAGAGKKGFLETLQEAQVLSVVDGVRTVLKKPTATNAASVEDLKLVERFVANPEDFLGGRSGSMSAAQIANNPFGDYAPQSTQIQGILKGMYDSFAAGLEKDNADEADKEKAFRELMATKKQELATLEATLEKQTMDEASKTKTLAESRTSLDDTKEQLEADEVFFADTKEACKVKAGEWAERTRLRTEELQGINKAIEILSTNEETFDRATSNTVKETSLLQVSSSDNAADVRNKAYNSLKALAKKFNSMSLAEVAVQLSTGGHFDKVIAAINKMTEVLRVEEQDDIAHRDRCQRSQNKNGNEKEDITSDIDKKTKSMERMNNEVSNLKDKIDALEVAIKKSNGDLDELLSMRNKEHADFKALLKDDADSVAAVQEAIVALSKFYKKNKIPLALNQEDPEYTVDKDKAPETSWSGSDYGGRKSENEGIIAILSMLQEDMEKEMKEGRVEDAESQAAYEKQRGALRETLEAQIKSKTELEREKVEIEATIADTDRAKAGKEADMAAEEKMTEALVTDCAWVETHFDSRAEKRKTEMAGLVEAKDYLAGIDSGDALA